MKLAHVLLLLPAILYVTITISWQQQGVNQITGDEPHYLLTADSILRDGDLLVVNNHQIDTPVLRCMPPKSRFGDDTHSLNGYSIHGLGLPLLLLPAYALGGVLGAKIWLAGLLGLIPISVYRRARALLPGSHWPLPIALLVGLSPPFLIGSNQLYPDLLAGLIIFTLLGGWGERRGSWRALGVGLLLALLPWLHLKFLLPALLLGALYALPPAPSFRPRLAAAVPLIVSVIGLGVYHQVAFGSPFGPYQAGDAAGSLPQVLMVALGLHLDRMQGLFFQAPLLLLGVVGLAAWLAESRRLALAGGAIYLALLLPSAAHTNWYGGASFAGRFFWALALLWVLPLLALLRRLRGPGQLAAVIGALLLACALEGIFLAKVLIPNSYTYTAPLHPT
ncbi:MAG: hypothetical protein HGA65_20305, partial [Oscillochloris sp.]|nr:hypothetical protein [Oscillochloris sp.]